MGIMVGLTNLISDDILERKKKNQEDRRKLAKMKSDKSMIKYLKSVSASNPKLPALNRSSQSSSRFQGSED